MARLCSVIAMALACLANDVVATWTILDENVNCDIGCENLGLSCDEVDFNGHLPEVGTSALFESVLATLGVTCGSVNSDYGTDVDAPSVGGAVCYLSDTDRLPSMNCAYAYSTTRRLCWCSEASTTTIAAMTTTAPTTTPAVTTTPAPTTTTTPAVTTTTAPPTTTPAVTTTLAVTTTPAVMTTTPAVTTTPAPTTATPAVTTTPAATTTQAPPTMTTPGETTTPALTTATPAVTTTPAETTTQAPPTMTTPAVTTTQAPTGVVTTTAAPTTTAAVVTTQAPQGTLTVELQVTISEADTFDNFLDIAMQSAFNWFSNAMADVTDIIGWDVLSITRLDDARRLSEGRRLADAEYAIILETKHAVSESDIDSTDLAQTIFDDYVAVVNSKISSSSWKLEGMSYASVQEAYTGLSASVGTIPKWSTVSNATSEDDPEVSGSVLATTAAFPAAAALAAFHVC